MGTAPFSPDALIETPPVEPAPKPVSHGRVPPSPGWRSSW